jgi:hypothetical protein
MTDLIVTTFDSVPETPRGYVRDIGMHWALEEAGLPYHVNRGESSFATFCRHKRHFLKAALAVKKNSRIL